ncbi:MAG: hypothetical protein COA84_02900 [Robiginitomaculum sp.]|nr:MAG: hypothetical protein COA84_02900 [Robiginitomaculum sp.]
MLPYVLVVIFILALTSAIAIRSLNTSGQIIIDLNADMLAEQRLATAEADTLYVFLTSAGVKGGIDTSNTVWTAEEELDGFDASRLSDGALWSAAGGGRVSKYASGEVSVIYRDTSGLIPINQDAPEMMAMLFKGLGLGLNDRKAAAAKLADYIDQDNRRRFRGAERADYRLKRRPRPSNAPLRAYEELYQIIAWDDLLTPQMNKRLRDFTTLTTSSAYYRTKFLSSELANILGVDGEGKANTTLRRQNIDIADLASLIDETPTLQGRFIFSTPKISGKIIVRVVELEKSPNAPSGPFRRYFIFEETRDVGDNNDNIEGKTFLPVFTALDRRVQ